MIESFVIDKINRENKIIEDLWGSLRVDEELSRDKILGSKLSDFTKNYVDNFLEDPGDKDEIISRIAKANKLRFNYAIRPKWTLLTYLFGNYESRPPKEIEKKLDLFPFYRYYADSVNDLVKDSFSIFVTKGEVSSILDETNSAIYDKLNTDINNAKIKNFFLEVFLLKYDENELNLESTVPYIFIRLFLNDKGYAETEKKFHIIPGLSDTVELSLKDIIKVMMNKFGQPEKEITPPAETEETSVKPEEPKKETEEIVIRPAAEKQKPAVTLQPKAEETHAGESDAGEKEKKPGSEPKAEKVPETSGGDIFSENASEIKNLMSQKEFEAIIDKIYSSSTESAARSFHKLSNFKTWFEASNHLKEVFKLNNVDIYDRDVSGFVDRLNGFFIKKG